MPSCYLRSKILLENKSFTATLLLKQYWKYKPNCNWACQMCRKNLDSLDCVQSGCQTSGFKLILSHCKLWYHVPTGRESCRVVLANTIRLPASCPAWGDRGTIQPVALSLRVGSNWNSSRAYILPVCTQVKSCFPV